MTKLLEIVIPIYNGGRFIHECLKSLLPQITNECSVVLVDDGSTDGAIESIEQQFAADINRGALVLLSQANAGVSAARNRGIAESSAEYIAFVDSDDTVCTDYIDLVMGAIRHKPDIVEIACSVMDEEGVVLERSLKLNDLVGPQLAQEVLPLVCDRAIWYPFLRITRREILGDDFFPKGIRFCEDMIAFFGAYKRAKSVWAVGKVAYNYRINSAGATKNIRPDYFDNLWRFYSSLAHEKGRAAVSLKLNIAYAMRRCSARVGERFGPLPPVMEREMLRLALYPRAYLRANARVAIMAIWGKRLNWVKGFKR